MLLFAIPTKMGLDMKYVLKTIDAVSEWTGIIVGFFIFAGAIVLVYETIMRYFFDAPTLWAHGVSQRVFAVYYILIGASVLKRQGHISMDIIYNRWDLRKKAIVDLVTSVLFFMTCYVLIRYGVDFAGASISILEVDNTPLRAPLYPIKIAIPLGGALLLFQGLAKFIRDLFTALTGKQYEY